MLGGGVAATYGIFIRIKLFVFLSKCEKNIIYAVASTSFVVPSTSQQWLDTQRKKNPSYSRNQVVALINDTSHI
jgi:hypothetical protein